MDALSEDAERRLQVLLDQDEVAVRAPNRERLNDRRESLLIAAVLISGVSVAVLFFSPPFWLETSAYLTIFLSLFLLMLAMLTLDDARGFSDGLFQKLAPVMLDGVGPLRPQDRKWFSAVPLPPSIVAGSFRSGDIQTRSDKLIFAGRFDERPFTLIRLRSTLTGGEFDRDDFDGYALIVPLGTAQQGAFAITRSDDARWRWDLFRPRLATFKSAGNLQMVSDQPFSNVGQPWDVMLETFKYIETRWTDLHARVAISNGHTYVLLPHEDSTTMRFPDLNDDLALDPDVALVRENALYLLGAIPILAKLGRRNWTDHR